MIYLDNSASSIVLPQVKEKLFNVLDVYGNPSSIHSQGRMANELIWETKDIIADTINCETEELYFTSGSTMSNNVLIRGFAKHNKFYISSIEHEDIQLIADYYKAERIKVDNRGYANINQLKSILENNKDNTLLFSVQMANGEIGTIQNIHEVSSLIHSYSNKFLHVDATQYMPYFKIDVQDFKIDALSMSGQKIGCIKGIGLLYVSNKLLPYIEPIILGKQGLIGGTENVPGIACLGEAFKYLPNYDNNMIVLRDKLIKGLHGTLIGDYNRLPNNVNMMFTGTESDTLVKILDENGICCSSGSACSSGDQDPSITLLAIGLSPAEAKSCVRFTLGSQTTEDEIKETIDKTNKITKMLRELNI